ncbi:hypothetical protein GOP47_0010398 [Adiantum capillus-veneris]|uniref:Uncharacterized protein n=1 Tax=Adiantum capillus-veneris TaxID=13818 RepID=A0A9D4ZHR0_ADICA|nr:hypothetical protein GOP47_0010398 [Adiantum capillus-veneris]
MFHGFKLSSAIAIPSLFDLPSRLLILPPALPSSCFTFPSPPFPEEMAMADRMKEGLLRLGNHSLLAIAVGCGYAGYNMNASEDTVAKQERIHQEQSLAHRRRVEKTFFQLARQYDLKVDELIKKRDEASSLRRQKRTLNAEVEELPAVQKRRLYSKLKSLQKTYKASELIRPQKSQGLCGRSLGALEDTTSHKEALAKGRLITSEERTRENLNRRQVYGQYVASMGRRGLRLQNAAKCMQSINHAHSQAVYYHLESRELLESTSQVPLSTTAIVAMACNTLSLTSSASSAAVHAPLSSTSAPFVAPSAPAMLAFPFSSSGTSMAVTCSLSDKEAPATSPRNAILTGLVAAGAALSVFTAGSAAPPASLAISDPGNSGAERTAQKAQDLLKSADKLNVEDSPQRFGPGRVAGSAQDAGKVAQNAGGKALSQIQGGVSNIASNLGDKKGDVQGAAESAASKVQSNIDDTTGNSGPGGIISSIKEGFQGLKESVASKDGDAKRTLDEAASNVQKTVQ